MENAILGALFNDFERSPVLLYRYFFNVTTPYSFNATTACSLYQEMNIHNINTLSI